MVGVRGVPGLSFPRGLTGPQPPGKRDLSPGPDRGCILRIALIPSPHEDRGAIMGDDPELWLTYEEAAKRLHIKPDSVRRRAAARKWSRRLGNDGLARVRIPTDAIPPDVGGDVTPARTPDASEELNTARVEISALRAELAGVRDRLHDTQADRDRWRQQAERLAEARKPVIGFLGRLLGRG